MGEPAFITAFIADAQTFDQLLTVYRMRSEHDWIEEMNLLLTVYEYSAQPTGVPCAMVRSCATTASGRMWEVRVQPDEQQAAWGVRTRHENLWPARAAILATIALYVTPPVPLPALPTSL